MLNRYLVILLCFLCFGASQASEKNDLNNSFLISKIESYLNDISSLRAEFIQIDPSGESSMGILSILRPGKLRWEYNPPVPILIVVNGSLVTYYDYELKQTSHASSSDSMIGFLAQKNIRFSGDVSIKELIVNAGVIRMKISKKSKDKNDHQVNLVFSENPLSIKKIELMDDAGGLTSISLNDIKYGVKLDSKLFTTNQLENKK